MSRLNWRVGRRVAAFAAFAVLGAACLPVHPAAPPLAPPPPDVPLPANSPTLSVDTNYVTGLDRPWDIAFLPSGTMLYTENDRGTISAYINAGEPRRVLGVVPNLDPSGEGGLMGLAVDPNFPASPFLYACYSNLSPSDNRVVRITLDPNLPMNSAITAVTPIITGMAHQGFHDGCRLRFQPGANPSALFVTMGDAAIGPAPQAPESLNGKILRVQTDGSPYPSNPVLRRRHQQGPHLHVRAPQPAGHRVPSRVGRAVLRRARPGLERRGEPARRRGQRWLGPGATRLQPEDVDDRPRQVPERDAPRLALR